MRLVKLEMAGFKSFAKKTELIFADGITAIIGPNGSGKSNIADAVRWVLGEQSAKALRGARMEDVIFSGTQERKSQSYCEVTLTFDNSDGALHIAFDEVAITRRVYRSGESEYCINKNNCRLKDIQELFRDTGIGKDGYSIIGQGRVDEILSNKSNDRRTALEEAAGVMRYRARKEEAQRKLDNSDKNLERIEDILKELSQRLGPLEEQSASARQYLLLRDELRDWEINLYLYQYEKGNERLKAAAEAIGQMTREAELAGATEQALLSESGQLETRIAALDQLMQAQQSELLTLLSGVETHVGESKVLLERSEHLTDEKARLLAQRQEAERRVTELAEILERMDAGEARDAVIARLDGDIASKDEALNAMTAAVAQSEEELESLKNAIIEAMNRISDARSRLSRNDAMQQAFHDRLNALEAEGERTSEAGRQLHAELSQAQEALSALEQEQRRLRSDLDQAQGELDQNQQVYAAAQEGSAVYERETNALRSRLNVLNEMARSREGYYASVKTVMQAADRDARLKKAIVGVVAELIQVPKEYELAVSMTLGSAMQNIITETAEDAQLVIEYLRANDGGRATLLPLTLLSQNRISENDRRLLRSDGVLGVAGELISYDPRIAPAISFLLGRTVIVKDLSSGVALKKRSGGAFHIATLEGDIISTGGSMSGGSANKKGFSLLGREREIAELTQRLNSRGQELDKRLEAVERRKQTIALLNVQIDSLRSELHAKELELTRQNEKTEIIRRDMEVNAQTLEQLENERQQITDNLAEIDHDRIQATQMQSDLETGSAASKEDVAAAQKALMEKRAQRETLQEELSELRVRRMALQKEQDAVENENKRIRLEREKLTEAIETAGAELVKNEIARNEIQDRIGQMQRDISGEQSQADQKKTVQQETENERAKLSQELAAQRARREQLLTSSRDLSERIHRQELIKSRTEMELSSMQDHIWEEYELTYENALPFRHDIAVGATNARIGELKTQIKELGEINVGAIEDFKAVSERYELLSAQSRDLLQAKADLEELIVQLTQKMEDVFLSQFAIIQKNFTQVFSELFGGGHAELRLADREDVLNCDIEIIAQPPGKKLQLLSLLSGGERALTAIALLFAMLRIKPPAFCVLDEIESSLDEANVSRFAGFLRDYSDGTQFIIITHRKGSMEVCNSLYGVAMEEKGVSRIVSARFGEAV